HVREQNRCRSQISAFFLSCDDSFPTVLARQQQQFRSGLNIAPFNSQPQNAAKHSYGTIDGTDRHTALLFLHISAAILKARLLVCGKACHFLISDFVELGFSQWLICSQPPDSGSKPEPIVSTRILEGRLCPRFETIRAELFKSWS